MPTGRVAQYDTQKNYGILTFEERGSILRLFFHRRNVLAGRDAIAEGVTCEFDVGEDPRRPGDVQAVNVRLLGARDEPAKSPTRVFLAELAYSVTEQELTDLLREFGEIKDVQIARDIQTGNSKGFAFCTFINPNDASVCCESLNRYEWRGLCLSVQPARSA